MNNKWLEILGVFIGITILVLTGFTAQINSLKNIDLNSELGQLFVVGVYGKTLDTRTQGYLSEIRPGGIILYRRNFESYKQIKELVHSLQKFAMSEIGIPFFIMIDEEPDGAARIDYGNLQLLKNVYVDGVINWERVEHDIQKLSEMGINVELAPVVDYPFNEESFTQDRIPVETKEELIAFNNKFIRILKENNIDSTLKHFPGLGMLAEDVHNNPLQTPNVPEDIWQESLSLFKQGIDQGAQFVMTNHTQYMNIEPIERAVFSKTLIEDTLRGDLGFQGFIISDDLSEMYLGEDGTDLADAAKRAIDAGHDLVLFSHKTDKTVSIFKDLVSKTESDWSFIKDITKKSEKIKRYKTDTLNISINID